MLLPYWGLRILTGGLSLHLRLSLIFHLFQSKNLRWKHLISYVGLNCRPGLPVGQVFIGLSQKQPLHKDLNVSSLSDR
jgi:hypothetical protein